MLRSCSIVVPVLDKQDKIARTLVSILESMAFFDAHHGRASEVDCEAIVVDDGSTDGTQDIVRRFARAESRVRLVSYDRRRGIGAARNTGVRTSTGQVLFFCDGDDLFLAEHLFLGFSVLDHSANAAEGDAMRTLLRVGNRGHMILDPAEPVAAIRTGALVRESLHPFWIERLRNSIAQTACVRRECHDWCEGFPEDAVYVEIGGCEDVAYTRRLNTFFRVGQTPLETVEYVRYPGNSLDRQIERFRRAPDPDNDVASPEAQAVHAIRLRLEEEAIGCLLDKWLRAGPPPLPSALLNWNGVVSELVRRNRLAEAAAVIEQAAERGQVLPDELTDSSLARRNASGLHAP